MLCRQLYLQLFLHFHKTLMSDMKFVGQVGPLFPPQAHPSLLHSSPNSLAGPRNSALIVALWPRPSLVWGQGRVTDKSQVDIQADTQMFQCHIKICKLVILVIGLALDSPQYLHPTPALLPNSLSGPTISALIAALWHRPSLAGATAGSQQRAKWAQKLITNCLACQIRISKLVIQETFFYLVDMHLAVSNNHLFK